MSETNIEDIASGSKTKKTRTKSSWIWQHFREEEVERNGKKITVIKCQEMIGDGPCSVTYKNTGNSTGNAINHLRMVHSLGKDGVIEESDIKKRNKVVHTENGNNNYVNF
jgi:hypothetical protein